MMRTCDRSSSDAPAPLEPKTPETGPIVEGLPRSVPAKVEATYENSHTGAEEYGCVPWFIYEHKGRAKKQG